MVSRSVPDAVFFFKQMGNRPVWLKAGVGIITSTVNESATVVMCLSWPLRRGERNVHFHLQVLRLRPLWTWGASENGLNLFQRLSFGLRDEEYSEEDVDDAGRREEPEGSCTGQRHLQEPQNRHEVSEGQSYKPFTLQSIQALFRESVSTRPSKVCSERMFIQPVLWWSSPEQV